MSFDLAGFVVVVLAAYLIPGPDFLIVTRFSPQSRSAGRAAAFGALAGLCVHMLVAALGLSALAANASTVFTVVKLLGAAYLVWLGVRIILSGSSAPDASTSADGGEPDRRSSVAGSISDAFRSGLLTNLLNPKAVLFFLSVLPQFIDRSLPAAPQILVLGVIDVLIGVFYWIVVIELEQRFVAHRVTATARLWWNRTCGSLLIGAGALLTRANM